MAKKRKHPKVARFWWFAGETVSALIDQLNRAGREARLEVRIDDKKAMTLQVVAPGVSDAAAAPAYEALNKSFICPPFCP